MKANSLRIVTVSRLEDLDAHSEAWNRLAASLPQNLPMLTYAWQRTVIEQEVAPLHPWVALFAYQEDDGALLGVLTASLEPTRALGLGRVVAKAPFYYHTDEGDLALCADLAPETMRALLRALWEHEPRVVRLELGGVREDSPTLAALAERPRGFSVTREPVVEGSSFFLEDDAASWLQGLSKNLRSDLKRSANKARKEGLGEAEVAFVEGADARPAFLDELAAIEATGWKAEAGGAIARDPGRDAKYHALAQRFADAGMLEWHLLRLDGRLAAAHMAVRLGDDLMLLRQGLEQDLARFGPGNHLIRAMVEREIDRGGGEINLVTDYPWCRRWRMRLTPYHRVVLAPRRPLPWLTFVLPLGARHLLQRTPGVRRLVRWARSRREGGGAGAGSR